MEKVNVAQKFDLFDEKWSPRIVGELNGQYVKLVKVQGEFVWHCHEKEDELFLVTRGSLDILLRDGQVRLEAGEFLIVPAGVEHKPVAREEAYVVLLEPMSTVNTGDVRGERTREHLDWI
jgi:mannose-6-phosphate isomerase-like protein (cupin superfamily)